MPVVVEKSCSAVIQICLDCGAQDYGLDLPTTEELFRALERSEESKAVILGGSGEVFCSGIDLQLRSRGSMADAAHYNRMLSRLMNRLQRFESPTFCAINGLVAGVGLELAFSCDVTVALPSTVLRRSSRPLNDIPGGAFAGFPFQPDLPRVRKLMRNADELDAVAAASIGLVAEVVDDLGRSVLDFSEAVSSQSRQAMVSVKRSLGFAFSLSGISERSADRLRTV